ncbi:diphosphomevalonate decarboxylase [Mesonia ostreae]|uniref:diphosphomevalonate decarboxylase n=1 Tax=Mesonia ostreae TaxID=861110 RepID=A0ABU2KEI5_9FLAO|nr:diphosphomevalonate decarboxylase [Mesonia ostreae]MDT0293113.1 diphosphomevalonate decarboxylase [Mesonia ostreae]
MQEQQFIPSKKFQLPKEGRVAWESPSNIALVKYWGKYGEQLPKNASISFTLSHCKTTTQLSFEKKDTIENFSFEIYLDGKRTESFEPKIKKFFERVEVYLPFLKQYHFKIETQNSFPHSSGIASSASGMSALALCLLQLERQADSAMTEEFFNKKASFLARLGSGSAARSIQGNLVVWGKHKSVKNSSNLYGVAYDGLHDIFKEYQDTILLVDRGEKQVSSTVGHDLMHNHPFADQRFKQANENLEKLLPVLASGNLEEFIHIVEQEALSLHAMMMTSHPYFILMKPNTLQIINKIWEFRKSHNSKVCFTLDAGANVHVLYPKKEKEQVLDFIKNQLVVYCQKAMYLCDEVGSGAKSI